MATQKNKPRKKKTKKKAVKKAAAAGLVSCTCKKARNGSYYCFKKVDGLWVECSGPFANLKECRDITGGRC